MSDDAHEMQEELEARSHELARSCDKCDQPGGAKTYANQALLPINGKVRCIDWCIHHIVAALNAGGIETTASCCGHGNKDGRIDLADGRVLVIPLKKPLASSVRSYKETALYDALRKHVISHKVTTDSADCCICKAYNDYMYGVDNA